MSFSQLEICCLGLESDKVHERKKNADLLVELLENKRVLQFLSDKNSKLTWDSVIESLHVFLRKQAEKLRDDERKNRAISVIQKNTVGNLLDIVITKAKHRKAKLNMSQIIVYFEQYFNSQCLQTYFSTSYLTALLNILSYQYDAIDSDQWSDLLKNLENRYKEQLQNSEELLILQCLELVFQFAPLCGLQNDKLRQEVSFVTEITKGVTTSSSTSHQRIVLKIILIFCEQIVEDNRTVCCKLGEEIFPNLIRIYQSQVQEIQMLLLKIFLFQVKIHHPGGLPKGSTSAYAYTWTDWHKYLRSLYSILCSDVNNKSLKQGNQSLSEEFYKLIVEVIKQVYDCSQSNTILEITTIGETSQQPNKKQKIEIGIPAIIEMLKDNKYWLWLNVMGELLKKFPSFLSGENFFSLLNILSSHQAECKFFHIRCSLYKCLASVIDAESSIDISFYAEDIKSLWCLISESTLRAIGLNDNEEFTHSLLQKLIIYEKQLSYVNLFKTYLSHVVNVSEFSIKTLLLACTRYDISTLAVESTSVSQNSKELLIKWILKIDDKRNNTYVYSIEETSQLLVFLTFKQFPKINCFKNDYNNRLELYEQTFLVTSLEGEIILKDENNFCSESVCKTLYAHLRQSETLDYLIEEAHKFASLILAIQEVNVKSLKLTLNAITLLSKLLSCMLSYDLLTETNFQSHKLTDILVKLFEKFSTLLIDILQNVTETNVSKIIDIFERIQKLLTLKVHKIVECFVRENISSDVLRRFFDLLNDMDDNNSDEMIEDGTHTSQELISATIDVLCMYSYVSSIDCVTDIQKRVLNVLSNPDFEPEVKSHFNMVTKFLFALKNYPPGILSNEILCNILNGLKNVCKVYYSNYNIALDIINILYYIYKHIALSKDEFLEENSLALLYPFYSKRNNYGPQVSIAIINCMGQLAKVDPSMRWSKWNGTTDVPSLISEFLSSDFQVVRISAIRNLNIIFKMNCNDDLYLSRLTAIFEVLRTNTLELLNINDTLTQEQIFDEILTHTSSALHCLAMVLICNGIFRQKALFTLFELIHLKNVKIESVLTVLNKVASRINILDAQTLIKNNLNYLISEWHAQSYDLNNFPYTLLNYSSNIEFYMDNFDMAFPILLVTNNSMLLEICQKNGKSLEETVEFHLPTVISQYLIVSSSDKTYLKEQDLIYKEKCSEVLDNLLTSNKIGHLILDRLHEIIFKIVKFCFDLEYIKTNLIGCILPKPQSTTYSIQVIKNTIHFIERNYLSDTSLILYFTKKHQDQLQKLILNLQSCVYNARNSEDRIIVFHHYTLLIDLIIPSLSKSTNLNTYMVRVITYFLIHLLSSEDEKLNLIACKYLKCFLSQILPNSSALIESYLVTFVSILVPKCKINTHVGTECIELLKLLVVDHANCFSEAIKLMDPFPQEPQFSSMQEMYFKIKHHETVHTLEDEIKCFLKTNSLIDPNGNRTEGLKHLKKQLSVRKFQLKELYDQLQNVRGFSEDCEKSLLHRLTCCLIKLTLSKDVNESTEATRCLGELGCADLSTIILQAEPKYRQENKNFFEFVTGYITSLLNRYIVESNIYVIEAASNALYYVLDSKEGKAILESELDYGFGMLNKAYLTPFISSRKIRSDTNVKVHSNFEALINSDALWCSENTTHDVWITKLACTILETFTDKSYLNHLIPVCKTKVEFCEYILPLLVYLILQTNYSNLICRQIQKFFSEHWSIIVDATNKDTVCINKASVQCMLNVIHFVRVQDNVQENKSYLTVNYLHVAQAALFCTTHFSALLYIELWAQESLKNLSHKTNSLYKSNLMPLDTIIEDKPRAIKNSVRHVLKESYKKIGELDTLAACDTIDLSNPHWKIERYERFQQWNQAALQCDIQVSNDNHVLTKNLLTSLKHCGLFQLPLNVHNSEPQYECAWRLSQWDFKKTCSESNSTIDSYKYFAMKALHNKDISSFKITIAEARHFIIDELRHASLECSKNLYEWLGNLQAVLELEDFYNAMNVEQYNALLQKWKIQDSINRNEFRYYEPIMSQRIVILNDSISKGCTDLKKYLFQINLKLASLARIEANQNVANRIVGSFWNSDVPQEIKNKILFEEAQIYWNYDKPAAKHIIRILLNNSPNTQLHASALKLLGSWLMETCSENPQAIINDYFLKSIELLNSQEKTNLNIKNICDTYDVLARFSDAEYKQILKYIKSNVFETKFNTMQKSKETANNMKAQKSRTAEEKTATVIHERQSKIDQSEIDNTYKEKSMYLKLAMKYYMQSINCSDMYNVRVFRIFSLWLENRSNTELLSLIDKCLSHISTYKFIPVLPQLIPHITSNKDDIFGQKINEIIERCAKDHPHHTLPLILAVTNWNAEKLFCSSTTKTALNEQRITGAETMLNNLKRTQLKNLISQMEYLSTSLVQLAYVDQDQCRHISENIFQISEKLRIRKVKNFDDVLLPTHTLPVQINGQYSNVVGISYFNKNFQYVGGVNSPKQITCMGTDGKLRTQLVKGRDDLRQDAIMQQVFSIMNEFFKANKQTSKLLIRTFKVVPLSQRSGILEWVENSVALGEYLCGKDKKPGAHQIYNPGDLTPDKCRQEFLKLANLSNEQKLNGYKKICERLKPVFHKFFETSFVQPSVWYERRLAYTHSVATSSMCGYILGLGDRHVMNILIDKNTAEVVHIDFGIAFEQGLVLPTPETVPFRLTRDLQAGMGIAGVEGVFRKSCEKTLEVLRNNAETIITILEVLLYDPLYTWTITPSQAYSRQFQSDNNATSNQPVEFSDQDNVPVNTSAERALLRLCQKLQGTSESAFTSVEGQVEKLIQQARDPSNLCKLFHGWQPYL